jgi:hypothetical protein
MKHFLNGIMEESRKPAMLSRLLAAMLATRPS